MAEEERMRKEGEAFYALNSQLSLLGWRYDELIKLDKMVHLVSVFNYILSRLCFFLPLNHKSTLSRQPMRLKVDMQAYFNPTKRKENIIPLTILIPMLKLLSPLMGLHFLWVGIR